MTKLLALIVALGTAAAHNGKSPSAKGDDSAPRVAVQPISPAKGQKRGKGRRNTEARKRLRAIALDVTLAGRELTAPPAKEKKKPYQIDQKVLKSVMQQGQEKVNLCYAHALERVPELAGRIVAELDVVPTGAVKKASIAESTLDDTAVEKCVARVVRAFVFPKNATPEPTQVTYYWQFQPSL
ncbi:MAG: AgmX/PglI C-terminal domain-containing protein [Myxococcota bacterium]